MVAMVTSYFIFLTCKEYEGYVTDYIYNMLRTDGQHLLAAR